MTLFDNLFNWPPRLKMNVHSELVKRCKEMVIAARCWGITTGEIYWKLKDTSLGRVIISRGPLGEADAVQNFKTQINQALDELQEEGFVHCDKIFKRRSIGCGRCSPVWMTAKDYHAWARKSAHLLQPERLDGRKDYPKRARKYYGNQ